MASENAGGSSWGRLLPCMSDTCSGEAAAESAGEPGRGTDVGESGCCVTGTAFDTEEALEEIAGVVVLDASPTVNDARNRSSRVNFRSPGSSALLLFEIDDGPGLEDRDSGLAGRCGAYVLRASCEPLARR